ncbi:zinc-ribbon domain-containing protein [Acidomonas methanolica]|nr:zinc-ribbon domain-containing protein [Acidomonas methanolica]
MRIVCPKCDAVYEVPSALVSTSRRLQCSRCGAGWFMTPEEKAEGGETESLTAESVPPQLEESGPEDQSGVEDEPEWAGPIGAGEHPEEQEPPAVAATVTPLFAERPVSPDSRPITPPAAPPSRQPLGGPVFWSVAWSASLAGVAGGVALLWHARNWIETIWPPGARLFTYCAHLLPTT